MSVQRKGSFRIAEQRANMQRLMKTLPVILGNDAQNHFLEGFRKGGGQTDASASGWTPPKSPRKRGHATLIETGALRRDIRRRETSVGRTVVGTRNIAYAARHNEGLAGMPKREFIGKSRKLESNHIQRINQELRRLIK